MITVMDENLIGTEPATTNNVVTPSTITITQVQATTTPSLTTPIHSTSTSVSATPNAISSKSNTGAIVGGAVGGVCFLGLLAFIAFLSFLKHRKNVRNSDGDLPDTKAAADQKTVVAGVVHAAETKEPIRSSVVTASELT